MRQRLGHRVRTLPRSTELRPVVRERSVVVDKPALDEHRHDQRRDRLGCRIDRAQRPLIPRNRPRPIGKPALQVNNKLVAKIRRETRAMLQRVREVRLERRADRFESGGRKSGDAHVPHIVLQRLRVNQIVRNDPAGNAFKAWT